MKKKKIISIVLLCALIAAIAAMFIFKDDKKYVAKVDEKEVQDAYNLLNDFLINQAVSYRDFLEQNAVKNGQEHVSVLPTESKEITLDYNETTEYRVTVAEDGLYNLMLDYKPMGKSLLDFNVAVTINDANQYDEMGNILLPLFWSDRTKDFPTDRYGDESAPYQVRKEEWTSLYLYNSTYSTAAPLKFLLTKGENVIRVRNISGNGLGLSTLQVLEPQDDLTGYEEYHKQFNGTVIQELIPIQSIEYVEKNSSAAIYESINNPVVKPHKVENKKLNSISWTKPGTELSYQFEAPEDGFYHIAFHYMNKKEEFSVFQTIRIDGQVPFAELQNYAFPTTGTQWSNETLQDGEGHPYEIWLTKGTHTISMRTEQEPIEKALSYARIFSDHVTQFDMAITKITGTTVDTNRTWKMTKYIPEIPEYLAAYKTIISEIKYLLQDYAPNGANSAMFSELDKAAAFIDQMAEYPDEIALYQDNLAKSRDNSILKSVSEFIAKMSASGDYATQTFNLNAVYVYGDNKLPAAKANILQTGWNGFRTLLNSYTSNKFKEENDPNVVNVWVNRATTHVDLLQKMVDTDFTPKTGIKVKVSVMPDQNKLILATAADSVPDVALGLGSHIPFDLASRGALYDMTQFDDFWEVGGRFAPGASVAYCYNEGVYAIPETLEFYATIYRTDIFQNLGLTPPDTWQDVTDMCPTLQRYGMNFYHNIASNAGYKWYYQTSSLIFQNGGKLYTEDGLRTALDQPEAVKGIQALGDLFVKYSLPKEVGSFFNEFRYGTLPIGTVSLQDYILIKNGAPELRGKWALSLYPGTTQEDGTVSRWFINNGTGASIFNSTKRANEAWEFLKWWTDYETQANYAYTLQSTYGEAFVWLSSNLDAAAEAPFDQADKQVILEQVKWLRDVPRTPGQYMVERSISDAWNAMVNEGKSAQVTVDERVISANREIRKKMSELGFYDKEGNLMKPYTIHDYDWIAQQIENARKKGE